MEDVARSTGGVQPIEAGTFEPFLGQPVRFAGTDLALVLERVERGSVSDHMPRAPFTLIFGGPRGRSYLSEGLYRCAFGPHGGAVFDIHVAPIHTAAADRQDYQAVFN